MRHPAVNPMAILAVLGLCASPALRGQGVFDVPDKFRVDVGWTFTSIDTEVSLAHKGALTAGVAVNFENSFALPVHKEAWQINGTWRMADRHLLDFGYQVIDRVGQRTLDRDITWGDYQINASGKVQATFNSKFPYLGYRYAFYEGGDLEMSGGGGISYLYLGTGLDVSGTLITNGSTGVTTTASSQFVSFQVPVPLLAFQVNGRITKDVYMTGFFRPVFFTTGDFKGGMNQFGLNVEWIPTRHVGFGLGLQRTLINIYRVETQTLEAQFRYDISGLHASAVFRF